MRGIASCADPRHRPLLGGQLPKRLEAVEPGQSYPELIAYYLAHPERDYGVLNTVTDPAKRPLSADERTLLETQKAEAVNADIGWGLAHFW